MSRMKAKKRVAIITTLIVAVVIALGFHTFHFSEEKMQSAIKAEDWKTVVKIYNRHISGNSEREKKYNPQIRKAIEEEVLSWMEEETEYERIADDLEYAKRIEDKELSKLAKAKLDFVNIENTGSTKLEEAEKAFAKDDYYSAISSCHDINKKYSQYDAVKSLYDDSKKIILIESTYPDSIEDYEKSQDVVNMCGNLTKDKDFISKGEELKKDKNKFTEAQEIIGSIDEPKTNNDYKSTFEVLEASLEDDPNNQFIEYALEDYHEDFVLYTSQQVKQLTSAKEYGEAISVIKVADEIYHCDTFDDLERIVEKERSPLFQIAGQVSEKVSLLKDKWTSEKFTVKTLADGTGKYIEKSGKRILLGDYSGEDITLLSFTGDIAASVLNLDLIFDLRDLSYDIKHLGGEQFFFVQLAVDTFALLPVVGVVKYMKNAKRLKQEASAADIFNASVKRKKALLNSIDTVAAGGKSIKAATRKAKVKYYHYVYYKTRNAQLKGKTHPKTGVPFKERRLVYSNGKCWRGVYPVFDSKATVKLSPDYYKAKKQVQFAQATKLLKKEVEKNNLLVMDRFNKTQLAQIRKGEIPKGMVWHHNEKEGVMELVDKKIHEKTGHTGGNALWGSESM